MQEFAGKTALVTGGSRGIGRAITLRLAEAGASVLVNYVQNERAAQATCEEVRARGGSARPMQADVGDPKAVRALFEKIRADEICLDALVHNAAVGRFKPLLRVRAVQWDMAFRTNAQALLLLAREALGTLREPGGSIVALSSLGSHRYVPFYGAIGISKAAVENLVRYLAVELAPRGLRVNAVSGGMIDGETFRAFPQHEVLRDAVVGRTPAGRLGAPEDLADVVLFLCSSRAGWIYGQTLIADGGFSLL
jgi:enoyl-[acyl-carrier protein] reductase III